MRRVIQRRSFYKKDGTKEWFLGERWYRGVVFRRKIVLRSGFYERMVQRSCFYAKDGTEEWFQSEGWYKCGF